MSYFEDFIEDGLACESCGELIDGEEAGFIRLCAGCVPRPEAKPTAPKRRKRRK